MEGTTQRSLRAFGVHSKKLLIMVLAVGIAGALPGAAGAAPPTVTTDPATGVGQTTATLNGTVNPNGQPTRVQFQIGLSADPYSNSTPEVTLTGKTDQHVAADISGLQPGTTYHYRAVARADPNFVVRGADMTFTTAAPVVVSIANAAPVPEGNSGTTNAVFTLTLSAPSSRTVTVAYATVDGTAKVSDSDYLPVAQGSVTFAPGETSKTITVQVVGDRVDEPDETFFVDLAGPTNATIGVGRGAGTIVNDDSPPSVSIDDVTVVEGDTGTTEADFTVRLSARSERTIKVGFASQNGTAVAPTDYLGISGELTFNPGDLVKTVTVLVKGNTIPQSTRTFFVNLFTPTEVTISRGQGVGTILDDDGTPTLSVADVSLKEGNAGTSSATFTIRLVPAAGQTVTVNYQTVDGTATSGSDYQPTSGLLSFTPGQTTKTVTVLVTGDTRFEPDESFYLDLSNEAGAAVAKRRGVGTIVNDDASPPVTVTTGAASAVGQTAATLNGSVNPNGIATTAHFEWGTTTSYGSLTPDQDVGSGSAAKAVSAALGGLAPGTTYHFRLVAKTGGATIVGADQTFVSAAASTVLGAGPCELDPTLAECNPKPPVAYAGVSISAAPVTMLPTGLAVVKLSCPMGVARFCKGSLRLAVLLDSNGPRSPSSGTKLRQLILGTASFQINTGANVGVPVRLSRQAIVLLKRYKLLHVSAAAEAQRDADGRTARPVKAVIRLSVGKPLVVAVLGRSFTALPSGLLNVKLACPSPPRGVALSGGCRGNVSLETVPGARSTTGQAKQAKKLKLGSDTYQLLSGRRDTFSVLLTNAGRKLLFKQKALKVKIVVTGRMGTVDIGSSRTITLRAPR